MDFSLSPRFRRGGLDVFGIVLVIIIGISGCQRPPWP
jgi:hypothetical protein